MTNIKRLMYCTPKMSDNACSLHCYDTTDNNVEVHWHYTSPKCARPGRISGTLCLNAPFARVCENSYFYEMAHVIIKCRVTFGKEMFNDCIKPHSICMRLVLSTQEEFSLKRAHYGHSPLICFFCRTLCWYSVRLHQSTSPRKTRPWLTARALVILQCLSVLWAKSAWPGIVGSSRKTRRNRMPRISILWITTSKCMHGMNQTEAEYSRHGKRSQRASLSQIGPVVLEE